MNRNFGPIFERPVPNEAELALFRDIVALGDQQPDEELIGRLRNYLADCMEEQATSPNRTQDTEHWVPSIEALQAGVRIPQGALARRDVGDALAFAVQKLGIAPYKAADLLDLLVEPSADDDIDNLQ